MEFYKERGYKVGNIGENDALTIRKGFTVYWALFFKKESSYNIHIMDAPIKGPTINDLVMNSA